MIKTNAARNYYEDNPDQQRHNKRLSNSDRTPLNLPRSCIHNPDVSELVSIFKHRKSGALVMEGTLLSSECSANTHGNPVTFNSGRYRKSQIAATYAANGRTLEVNPMLDFVCKVPYYDAVLYIQLQRSPNGN